MFAGFDPRLAPEPYLERRRGRALAVAILVHVIVAALIIWIEATREAGETEDVLLAEPDIENLEVEIEEEPEPEPEPEPEQKPKPKPQKRDIQNVTKQTEQIVETDVAPERAPEPEDDGDGAPEPPPKKEEPVEETPKPKKKRTDIGDREKARPMPANAKPPQPDKSNKAPKYPEKLRKKNVTGMVKVKLNIHMDGSVRGMKVLKKSVSGTQGSAEEEEAKKLFLKAVISAVKTWKFKPAKLKGKTISVWWPVTIPFNLN